MPNSRPDTETPMKEAGVERWEWNKYVEKQARNQGFSADWLASSL